MTQGRFVSGTLKKFGASGRRLAVDVIIPSSLESSFEIIEKSFLPENVINPDGSKIIWITNIGLQAKGSQETAPDYYEIQVSRASTNLSRIDKVYIYVDNQAQALSPADFDVDYGGKVVYRLNLMDPASGLGGR